MEAITPLFHEATKSAVQGSIAPSNLGLIRCVENAPVTNILASGSENTKAAFECAMEGFRSLLPQAAVLALLCAGLMTFANTALAQANVFVPTGSMVHGRYSQTATLLNNGNVLVAGGGLTDHTSDLFAYTAELYNPAKGSFTETTSLTTERYHHTGTLLDNGKVLIIGGENYFGSVVNQTAEIYDPATGIFTAAGSMITARWLHTATLLNNGTVLVAGGTSTPSGNPVTFGIPSIVGETNSAELYDPATGIFTATGSMVHARAGHIATLLKNGMVLMTGGEICQGCADTQLTDAELYDPVTGSFTATGSMTVTRNNGSNDGYTDTATLLNSGQVLVTGGIDANGSGIASAELYDPTTGTFSATGSMTASSFGFTATLLNNGTVLVAGTGQSFAELYDPANGAFTRTSNLTTIRFGPITGTLLSNGGVLVAGGFTNGGFPGYLQSAELYGPAGIAALSLSSPTLFGGQFGSQYVGATGSGVLTLTSTGDATLSITSIAVAGLNSDDFAQVNTCGNSVAVGAMCNITVNFTPTTAGNRIATLAITDNAAYSPQTVTLMGTGQDFSVTPISQSSATVAPGQMASYSIAVAPDGGFNQSVTFTCSGAPPQSTCAVSPNTVALNGSTAATLSVTVMTTAASLFVTDPPASGPPPIAAHRPMLLISGLLGLAFLASLLGLHRGRRPRLAYGLAFLVLFLLSAGMTLSACGNGGSNGGGGGNPGTPAGNYTLVVSGTFTSVSGTLTHKTNLTLVVQ